MRPRLRDLLAICCLAATLSACATATRGVRDTMVVDTNPPGATVTTDRRIGTEQDGSPRYAGCAPTPCEFKVSRRAEFLLTIDKEGFEPLEVGVTHGFGKTALRSTVASSGKTGIAMGVTAVAAFGSYAGSAGAAAVGGAAVAGIATAGVFGVSLAVDGATGALQNLQPNPIVVDLPPQGTEVIPHDGAVAIREKRDRREEKRK